MRLSKGAQPNLVLPMFSRRPVAMTRFDSVSDVYLAQSVRLSMPEFLPIFDLFPPFYLAEIDPITLISGIEKSLPTNRLIFGDRDDSVRDYSPKAI
jgi:hypothetical protein